MAKTTTSNKSVKTKTTTSKSVSKATTKRTVEQTNRINARKEYYTTSDVLQMNSTVNHAKNSTLPNLSKKCIWLYNRLAKNDIKSNFNYTLTSLSNDYRKEIATTKESNAKKQGYKFRSSFTSSEVFSVTDIKSVCQYFYHANDRLFEFYRNAKGNYLLHEIEFKSNLSVVRK